MKIRNVSGDDREVVPADGTTPFTVGAGHTADVDDALGANMLDQSDVWRAADTTSVPDGTAKEVLAWVGDSQARADAALAAEQEREKPRSTLVDSLAEIVNPEKES